MARPVLHVYVGAQRLQAAWRARRGTELRMLFDQPLNLAGGWPAVAPAAMDALILACRAEPVLQRGAELRVLVSDHWVPSACVPWSAAQYRSMAAVAVARDELREAGCAVASGDVLRLDDAPLRQPRVALCYPAELIESLKRLATQVKARLSSINTLSALAWRGNDVPVATPACSERVLAILEPGDALPREVILVRGQRTSACIDEVALRLVGAGPTVAGALAASVTAIVRRLGWNAVPSSASPEATMLFSMIDLRTNDPLTGITGPMAWWITPRSRRDRVAAHALDAVARCARPSLAKSLLLVGVLGGIGLASVALWRNEARWQEALDAASVARRAVVVAQAPSASPEQIKRIAAIDAVVSELNIPLPRLLRALQPPKDIRVGLLGLELVAGRERGIGPADARAPRPTLKVHAEAPASADMMRYVAFLSERKPLNHAYLVRHEAPDSAAPRGIYRFTVEVAWMD